MCAKSVKSANNMRHLLILICLCSFSAVIAQRTEPKALFEPEEGPDPDGLPRFTLKSDIFPWLFTYKRAANLSSDIRVGKHLSTDLSLGYFLNSGTFARLDGESYRGLRLRGGINFYPSPKRRSPVFFGIQLKYNNISNKTWRQVSRQGDQYLQWLLMNRQVQDYGFMLRISRRFYFGEHNRIFLDYSAGLGGVWYNVEFRNLPADATLPVDTPFLIRLERPEGAGAGVDFLWQLSLGYAIW